MRILTVTLLIRFNYYPYWTSLVAQTVKHLPTMRETCREVLLEKEMATHSSILAWRIPWMEEPGGLLSMGSLTVRHNWATSLSRFTFMHWRRKWQPTTTFFLENPRDRGACWVAVCGVAQSQTRPKWLNSSGSIYMVMVINYIFWLLSTF